MWWTYSLHSSPASGCVVVNAASNFVNPASYFNYAHCRRIIFNQKFIKPACHLGVRSAVVQVLFTLALVLLEKKNIEWIKFVINFSSTISRKLFYCLKLSQEFSWTLHSTITFRIVDFGMIPVGYTSDSITCELKWKKIVFCLNRVHDSHQTGRMNLARWFDSIFPTHGSQQFPSAKHHVVTHSQTSWKFQQFIFWEMKAKTEGNLKGKASPCLEPRFHQRRRCCAFINLMTHKFHANLHG